MNEKNEIIKTIVEILKNLHEGKISLIEPLLDLLKEKALSCNEKVQKDLINFTLQVEFQKDYDPEHLISKEIAKAADKLLSDLLK